MKSIYCLGILLVATSLQAQTINPGTTNIAALPTSTPYAVVSRDANSAVWQRQTYEIGPNGIIVTNVHRYVELATGLNYEDKISGQYFPSKEEIDAYPGGAIAQYGQHKVVFANNLNTSGAIDLQTPDGKELRSGILGLSYYDTATEKSVLIAEVQDSQGQIVSSNQVVYPNAFQGLSANVRYCYTRAGLEQDVILLTQLPTPESFGLSATSCVLQVLTEFTNPPAPVIQASPSVTNDVLGDEMLDFGAMKMVRGRAFLLGTNSPPVLISKQWLNVGGWTILVESMPLALITKSLSELPAFSATSLNRHPGSVQYLVSNQRLLPSPRTAATTKTEMKLTLSSAPARGFDLDLIFVNSSSNAYIFAGDNTYWVTGPVNFSSSVTFEGGSVIKYSANASLNVYDPGQIICEGMAYRPTIFTSKDDNSVGTAIGSGTTNGFYANPAIAFNGSYSAGSSMTLHDFRISYALQAIYTSGISVNAVVQDGQIVKCYTGFNTPGQTGASFRNVLFANVSYPFELGIASVQAYNSTFCHLSTDLSPLAVGEAGLEGSSFLTLENCILANIYAYSTNMANLVTGDHNGFYNSGVGSQSQYGGTNFGTTPIPANGPPFQSVGAGNYYLTNGCAFLNVGTTNIDPVLLADLKTRTTYPPQVLTSDFTGNTTLAPNPNVVRDSSSSPDLGYHYDPLDYCLSGLSAGTTLTLTNGVAIGIYGSSGLSVGGQLISQGTPNNHNQLVYYSLVQEQPSAWGAYPFNNLFSSLNQVRLRFTDMCMAAGQTWNFSPNVDGGGISLVDCQLQTAFFNMVGMNWGGMAFTNNIFARCNLVFNDVASGYSLNFYNNLFLGGTLSLNLYNLNWNVYDNLFNSANFHIWNYAPNHGYNAYYNAAIPYDPHTGYTTPGNQALTTLDFQAGPLGSYYYPKTGSGLNLLRNAGSTTADERGLYHYAATIYPKPNDSSFSVDQTTPLLITSVGQEAGILGWAKQSISVNGNTVPNKFGFLGQYFDPTSVSGAILSEYGDFFALQPGQFTLKTKADPDQGGMQGSCTVYAISLNVDANHDGFMDKTYGGPDTTSPTTPYVFWINNNYDRSTLDPDDNVNYDDDVSGYLPNSLKLDTPDCNYKSSGVRTIPTMRDLEDFSRLWVSGVTPDLLAALPPGSIVTLTWGDVGNPNPNNPTIDLFQAADANGGTGYLTDETTAQKQVDITQCPYIGRLGPGGSIQLNASDFANDWAGNYFIWCGVSSGSGALTLTISDVTGQTLAQTTAYIQLVDIKQMYDRWSVGENPSITPSAMPLLIGANQYPLSADPNAPYILFVHGWNVQTWEKDRFAETAFKRLYWQGYQGKFGEFRWPTPNGNTDAALVAIYDPGEYNAWNSSDGLLNKLNELDAQYPGHVYVLAHSMGNVVTGEALRKAGQQGLGQLVNTYVATQAAVPGHCYDSTLSGSDLLGFEAGFLGPTTANIYNNWLTTGSTAAEKIVNLFNANDYALNSIHWQLDEESKPDWFIGIHPPYGYNGSPNDNPPQQNGFYSTIFLLQHTLYLGNQNALQDRYEITAFAAEPRSLAMGSINMPALFGSVYLGIVWPPDTVHPLTPYDEHFWHSAEFRGDYWQQEGYWSELLGPEAFNLK
jgi:hypothetical protein